MRLTRFALALATGLVVAGTAAAHSELHSADWCNDGVVIYRGQFAFSSAQLQDEFARRQTRRTQCLQETGALDGDDICGIFDPPYEMAVSMARAACGDSSSPVPSQESAVVAFVTEPESFNDISHHGSFDLNSGLKGLCGVCVRYGAPIVDIPPYQN